MAGAYYWKCPLLSILFVNWVYFCIDWGPSEGWIPLGRNIYSCLEDKRQWLLVSGMIILRPSKGEGDCSVIEHVSSTPKNLALTHSTAKNKISSSMLSGHNWPWAQPQRRSPSWGNFRAGFQNAAVSDILSAPLRMGSFSNLFSSVNGQMNF